MNPLASGKLPTRAGDPPQVHPGPPQRQLNQKSPPALQDEILRRASALSGVSFAPSFAEQDATAFVLDSSLAVGPPQTAFLHGHEFAHIHADPDDGSLHMTLPPALVDELVAKGWGLPHPLVGQTIPDPRGGPGTVDVATTDTMVFGPRTHEELETVWQLVSASHAYATGQRVNLLEEPS